MSVQTHAAPVSAVILHPRGYRKIFLGNYLRIGFVPGGIRKPPQNVHLRFK